MRRPYRKREPADRTIATPDKTNLAFFAATTLALGDQHRDYPAVLLANYILGGTSVSRLYTRIRAKEGLSYSVGSSIDIAPQEESTGYVVFAISHPANTLKVQAAFLEEVQKALKEGFSAEEVAAAKKGWLQSQTVTRSADGTLARLLRGQTKLSRTMAFQAVLEKKISAATAEEVSAALRRHLNVATLAYFKAGDFKKAAAK